MALLLRATPKRSRDAARWWGAGARGRPRRARLSLVVLVVAGMLGPLSRSARSGDSIGAGIPAEAVIYGHWASGSGDGFVARELAPLRDALRRSGFIGRFVEGFAKGRKGEDRKRFDASSNHWRRLLDRVSWWKLLEREGAFGAVPSSSGRLHWIFLFRCGEELRNPSLIALRRILEGLGALAEGYELIEADRAGVPTTVLYSLVDVEEQIAVGGWRDTIVLTTSTRLARVSLQLLAGEGSGRSIVHSEAYRAGLRHLAEADRPPLPAPKGFEGSRGSFELVLRGGDLFKDVPPLRPIDSYHYLARYGEGRLVADWRLRLSGDDGDTLTRALAGRPAAEDLLDRVPASAVWFAVNSGADPDLVYDWAFDLVEALSGGPLIGRVLQRAIERADLDLKQRVLPHLTGRRVRFRLPGPREGGDPAEGGSALLLELKEGEAARTAVRAEVEKVLGKLESLGLHVERGELEGLGSFAAVDARSLAGFEIVVGVGPRDLTIATSRAALVAALQRGAGRVPSVLGSPDFRREWPAPPGRLEAVAWGRCPETGGWIETGVQAIAGLVRFLPQESKGGFLRPLLDSVSTLRGAGSVLRIFERERSVTLRVGSGYRGRSVLRMRRAESF